MYSFKIFSFTIVDHQNPNVYQEKTMSMVVYTNSTYLKPLQITSPPHNCEALHYDHILHFYGVGLKFDSCCRDKIVH